MPVSAKDPEKLISDCVRCKRPEAPPLVRRAAEIFEGEAFPEDSPHLFLSECRFLDRLDRAAIRVPWIPLLLGTPASEANVRAIREHHGPEGPPKHVR